jgi:hypothetical protein
MGLGIRHVVFGKPLRAIGSIGFAFAAALTIEGCIRVEEHPYARPAPPPAVVEVEQPVVTIEPITAVVYEPAPPQVVAVYDSDLGPYGHWVTVGNYGRCWVWNGRHADWRPYTVGHWVASDQGWLWVSEGDEAQWGGSCYHYGRWFEDPTEGWVWVPGSVWAPSWCAWRSGGDYTCWAPLPPECGDGHVISAEVVDRYCPASRFYCVETRNMVNINIRENVIVNNVTIINQTTNITNITYVNNRAVNRGVDVKIVEKATGKSIKIQRPAKVTTAEEARRQIALGHPVVYAPKAIEAFHKEHPVAKGIPHKETSAKEEHKPAIEEKKPVIGEEHKPVAEEKKPVIGEEHKPVVEEKKPVIREEEKPTKEEKKPVIEEKKPVIREEEKPTKEEKKPVVEEKKPVTHEEVKPTKEEKKPVVEEKKPEEKKTEEKKPVTNKPAADPKKDPKKKPEEQK